MGRRTKVWEEGKGMGRRTKVHDVQTAVWLLLLLSHKYINVWYFGYFYRAVILQLPVS